MVCKYDFKMRREKSKEKRLNKRPEIIVFVFFIYREQFYGR